jgi:hypothetical protein
MATAPIRAEPPPAQEAGSDWIDELLSSLQPSLREEALAAVAADNAARYVGVRGDLFAFEDLQPCAPASVSPDRSLPIVVHNKHVRFERVDSSAEYRGAAVRAIWSWLPDFGGRLIAAGGSVSRLVSRQALGESDIDLFPVGISREDVRCEIRRLGAHLAACCAPGEVLHVYRTRYCVSYVVAGAPGSEDDTPEWLTGEAMKSAKVVRATIQVILRIYSTVSEVLHGFDLGSCAVADDGRRLYFTSASKLAFERGLNVLDLTRRRANYELRAVKYLTRGFALALPELAHGRFPDRLPYLHLGGEYDQKTARIRVSFACPIRPGGSLWSREIRDNGGWSPVLCGSGAHRDSREKPEPRAPRPAEPLYVPMKYNCNPVGFADLVHNLHSLRMGRPEAFRVHALYAPDLDICDLQPLEALGRLGSRFDALTRKARDKLSRLIWSRENILELAFPESLKKWGPGEGTGLDNARGAMAIRAGIAKYAAIIQIPLRIETADDATIALSSTDARVSSAIWYGPHLAREDPHPLPGCVARGLIVALLGAHLPAAVAAFVMFPYLGEAIDQACSICWRSGLIEDPDAKTAVCLRCGADLVACRDVDLMKSLPTYVPMALGSAEPEKEPEEVPGKERKYRRAAASRWQAARRPTRHIRDPGFVGIAPGMPAEIDFGPITWGN